MMNHLEENNMSYLEHWWRAMKISGALFVHAFLPDILSDYASKEINNNEYNKSATTVQYTIFPLLLDHSTFRLLAESDRTHRGGSSDSSMVKTILMAGLRV